MSRQGTKGVQAAPISPSSEHGLVVTVMTREDISPEGAAVDQNRSKLSPTVKLGDVQAQGDRT